LDEQKESITFGGFGDCMILGILYSLQHIISILFYDKHLRIPFLCFSFFFFVFIYSLKPDTYDIIAYTNAVSYPYYEPGFSLIILALRPFLSNRAVILVIQILIGILTYLTVKAYIGSTESIWERGVAYALAFFSVAFTLGVNNGLRQYMASLIIFIAIWEFLNGHKIVSFLVFLFAPFIHYSSIMFYLLVVVILFFSEKFYFSGVRVTFSMGLVIFLFLIFSILTIITLPVLVSYTRYTGYLDRNITSGRVDFSLKYSLVLLSFLVSEFYFGKIDKKEYIFSQLRIVRMFLIILMFFLSFFNSLNEMSSRILGFYFTLEMLVLCLAYVKGYKTSAFLINLSYAFAINAINVIGRI